MSSVLHPVGPERRTTYWRRRLVVVLLLLALVVGATTLVRSLGTDADAQPTRQGVLDDPDLVSPTLTSTASPTAAATASPTATPAVPVIGPPVACAPPQLAPRLTTDVPVYGPGVAPQFKLLVQNTSDVACTAQVGAGTRTFVVQDATGARVWSTEDCAASTAVTTALLLAEGMEQGDDSDTVVMNQRWNLDRSAPGCPTEPLAPVDDGTYTLTGTWAGLPLTPVSFSVTR